tara:strand:- start:456 stop:686 length:231 start_codon:yes stop_codon:yes gene_type:complete
MKNGNDKIFNVKKSFVIGDQIVIMEGDQLKWLSTDNNDGNPDIYFEVVNSFWCNGMEINLTPKQVAEHLTYSTIYR